jgi:DNA mismatch repair protein MLH1
MYKYSFLGRYVTCRPLKRAIDALYSTLKGVKVHFFVYLSLEIKPQNVDVNVHPTKEEVNFLNEEKIIQEITTAIKNKIAPNSSNKSDTTVSSEDQLEEMDLEEGTLTSISNNDVRYLQASENFRKDNFPSQISKPTFFSNVVGNKPAPVFDGNGDDIENDETFFTLSPKPAISTPTSKTQRQITNMFSSSPPNEEQSTNSSSYDDQGMERSQLRNYLSNPVTGRNQAARIDDDEDEDSEDFSSTKQKRKIQEDEITSSTKSNTQQGPKKRKKTKEIDLELTSIKSLIEEIDLHSDPQLGNLLCSHKFVGVVDRFSSLLQHADGLYLVNNFEVR